MTGTRRSLRLSILLVVTAFAVGGAWVVYGEYREPIRAAARDFLTLRRVHKFHDVLLQAARESGVDPYLLAGIMVAESSGRVDAVSHRDALGLFQLTQVTADWRAKELGLEPPTREALLSDPLLNARLGADNVAWLLDTYEGDTLRALCAYNAGARKLKRLTDAAGGWEAWRTEGERSGRSAILRYAHKVLRIADEYRATGMFDEENHGTSQGTSARPAEEG